MGFLFFLWMCSCVLYFLYLFEFLFAVFLFFRVLVFGLGWYCLVFQFVGFYVRYASFSCCLVLVCVLRLLASALLEEFTPDSGDGCVLVAF